MHGRQTRLSVKELDVSGAAILKEVDDPFCFGGEMRDAIKDSVPPRAPCEGPITMK